MKNETEKKLDEIAKDIKMTTTHTPATNVSTSQNAEIENALAELETVTDVAEEIEEIEAIEESAEDEVLAADEVEELELEVDKAESYAAQASTPTGDTADGKIKKEGTTKPRNTGAKRASTPRAPRDMASVPAEHFVLTGKINSKTSSADLEAAKKSVMASIPKQVKVADKFENVFASMAAGRAPSKYVITAFSALDTMKTMSSGELIAAFKTSGVGEGTARSQTGQIMVLFKALGLADRDGKNIKLKAGSNVAEYLRKHVPA